MSMVWLRYARFLVLTIFGWTGLATAEPPETKAYEGRRIVDIQFSPPEQPVALEDLERAITLKKGTPLRMAEIRESMQKLFATGRFEDIQVGAEAAGDGVIVRFITRNSWFVGHVSVDGNVGEPPNPGQMADATRLDLGQPFHEEDLIQAERGVRRLLTANGYSESDLQPRVEYDPKTQQAHIHFVVESGPRAKYRTPVVLGNLKLAVDQIVLATRWKRRFVGGWRPVTQTRTRQGVEGVRALYQKKDRLMASVRLKSMDYDHDTDRATPTLDVDAGPIVSIQAIGAKVSNKKLQQNVPIYEERAVDRDLLVEGQRNLRDEFQAAGYFEAEVEFKEQKLQNDRQEIDYLINLGPRHQLVHLEIQGNHYFTSGAIRDRMYMAPKSFQLRRGRYSEALQRRDEESIGDLYQQNGFRDVKVTSKVGDDYKGKTGDVGVVVIIDEGPQWFVSKLEVAGIQQLDAGKIIPTLSSTEGQPFSDFSVAADRDAILAYYFTNGFANASFEWSSKPAAQPHQVELRFVITEGRRQFVQDVLVEGLNNTQPALVSRNLLLAAGDPLSPIRMADTQRRLYDLGIFATVDMAIQNPEGDTQRKYVIYEIEEAKKYSIDGGVGAEIAQIGNSQTSLDAPAGTPGFSPRVSFDVSRLNVLGLGHTISLRTRVSNLEQRAILTYLAPRVHNRENLDLSFSALFANTRDVQTFSSQREEGSVQLAQKLSKPSSIIYRFSYRRVSTSNLKIDPNLVPLLSQPVRVGILSTVYIQDRRDDPTDAHKGIYNTVDIGLASKYFGSQVDFGRVLARNATYHPLGKKLVLARETTFGDIIPFNYQSRTADVLEAVPFPERFFGGGTNSLRAFPDNQAGPRDLDTGFPIGGTALLLNKTELRFPLLGANIGGVLFHDAGNIYSKLGNLSFRVRQRDVQDFDYMVHAVGFGIRYRTPIGPVRVDFAYSINPPRFHGCSGTIDDLIICGNEPASQRTDHSIGHFQFFFSIGQAF
ncbi:MAG: BamA/TamA family outer membrane protein [Acidobacteriia bacterium]|nr:BamA/TamA family outer membrane protein [Terriglobia bacterium]